jgi:predicted RNA binding protein YcfA (HicA-like mRNA interferase family)
MFLNGRREFLVSDNKVRELIELVEIQGATIRTGKNAHYKVYHPNGKMVTVSATPKHGDYRKVRADLRRAGFQL